MLAKFRGQLSFFTVQCVIFKAVNRGSVWVFNKDPEKTGCEEGKRSAGQDTHTCLFISLTMRMSHKNDA